MNKEINKTKPMTFRLPVIFWERLQREHGLKTGSDVAIFFERMYESVNDRQEKETMPTENTELERKVNKVTEGKVKKVVLKGVSEPKEGTGSFFLKYGVNSYGEMGQKISDDNLA